MKCKYYKEKHGKHLLEDVKHEGMKLEIEVLSFLDGYHKEELEDKIKEFLREYGVKARIKSSTGNELSVSPKLSYESFRK